MLRPRLVELAQRRERLQYRIEQQRTRLAGDMRPILPVISTVDSARNAVRWVRGHPGLALVAVAAAVIVKPRFAFRWGKRGLLLWQTWRRVRKLAHR